MAGSLFLNPEKALLASGDLTYRPLGNFRYVHERLVRKLNGFPDFQNPAVCPIIFSM